jgi:hypothetical protein
LTVKRIVANKAAKEVGSAQAFYGDVLERNCVGVLGRTNTSARLTRSVHGASGLVLVGHSETNRAYNWATMDNKQIARILRDTAQLLEIDGAIAGDGYRTLQEGDPVEFEIVQGAKRPQVGTPYLLRVTL